MTSICLPKVTSAKKPAKSKKKKKYFNIGIVSSLTKANKSEFFFSAMEAMCELDFQVMVLAEGDEEAQKRCFMILEKHPNNFSILESTTENQDTIIKNSDVILFANKPNKKTLKKVINSSIVSILPEGSGLTNFEPQRETGEAFTFPAGNFWHMITAIIKASENFKFPYDWRNVKKNLGKVML